MVAAAGAKLHHGFTQQLFPLLAGCAEATHYEVAYANAESSPSPAGPAIGDKRVL